MEAAITALAAIIEIDVTNVKTLTSGSSVMALVIIQCTARIETLETKLEEALSRIEALEKP
ncbi:MAG: hypothetical protein WC180_03100 [Candidatus Paceibacterota bacterium]